jgi:hypothetical protein
MRKTRLSCVFILSVNLGLSLQFDLFANSNFKIDRHNTYREINGIYFPHHENPMVPLRSSLVDGELVIDVDPRTKQVFTILPSWATSLYNLYLLVIGKNSLSGFRLSGYR